MGNPGAAYAHTRHNVGADVVGILAERNQTRLKASSREHALTAEARAGGRLVALAIPQTFMNDSGLAVARLVRRYGVDDLERLVVVQDELDLPVGRMKLKAGGGTAGHNGLRSIEAHLHSNGFSRVRIGVGKPAGRREGADHVLSRFGKREQVEIDLIVQQAADAVEVILADGMATAMNRFNTT